MTSVGVVGLGQMGRGIAANLSRAGFLRAVFDPAPGARELPFCRGIVFAAGREMAAGCDVIVFVVPTSREIAATLDGPDGILSVDHPGQVLVDLTTSDPERTRELAARAAVAGRAYLDCGMTGGAAGADAGTLTLMVGGEAAVLEQVRPVLAVIAKTVALVGPRGAGHTLKLIHNMIVHTNFLVLGEGCRMAEKAGLDLSAVIDVFNAGNARSFISEKRFPNHILSGRFDGRSTVSNLAKDLGMAAAYADRHGEPAPYTHLTADLLKRAIDLGWAGDDFTTIYPRLAELLEPK
ncbi:MAG: NAD(P)-dependent oxidoreductase [Rhodoplanes sp.]|uniref:NAD(P)-dependent oxidoreductase n=1 Tax=Rhodoplanes sp. TaxID=1968906 RepID=UPI00180085F2|nr:NAD(P)-dependent oxidoreductase [Rhodoplanes sp.]NVO16202.1 NAD(P)-dependent oxidoreductase [Rhodoplanes sp.]